MVCALGEDAEAATVRDAVSDHGIGNILPVRSGRTSLQVIDCEPNGEKVFVRYEAGVLADYEIDEAAAAVVARSDVLIIACYRQVVAFFNSALRVQSAGIRAVDFLDLTGFEDRLAPVELAFDRFDIGFAGLRTGDGDLIDGLEALAQRCGKLFIVTMGAQGSVALGGPDRVSVEAVAVVDVVDTTGAGDSFAAGFLGAFSESRDVASSLAAGAHQASLTVKRFGAFNAELRPWPRGEEPV